MQINNDASYPCFLFYKLAKGVLWIGVCVT